MTDFSQEEKSDRLHRESFVFDFAPYGEPVPLTERTHAAMREALTAGGLPEVLRRLWGEHLRELEEDEAERERVATEWRDSGVNGVQVTLGGTEMDTHGWDATLRDAGLWHRRAAIGEQMAICRSAEELRRAQAEQRVGILLGLQDTLQIGSDLDRLESLYGLGVRVVQLTYNRRNLVGDGCTERHQSGLSRFGLDLVRELNRLGIVVDVSHSGVGTTNEAVEASTAPAAFTHTACRAIYDHPRAKSDEQLALLAEHDGYVGIVAVPFFLGADGAGPADVADHVAHAAGIVGVERVGIATDWGFWSLDFPVELRELAMRSFQGTSGFRPDDLQLGVALDGFERWQDWPVITRGLLAKGFSEEEVRGLLGGNWLRYLERVEGAR